MAISNEERIARLEGGYEHLATKADVADVRAEVADTRADLKSDIDDLAQANGHQPPNRPAVLGCDRNRWRSTGCCRRRPDSGCAGLTPEEMVVKTL